MPGWHVVAGIQTCHLWNLPEQALKGVQELGGLCMISLNVPQPLFRLLADQPSASSFSTSTS